MAVGERGNRTLVEPHDYRFKQDVPAGVKTYTYRDTERRLIYLW